jgi:hypothetical protein
MSAHYISIRGERGAARPALLKLIPLWVLALHCADAQTPNFEGFWELKFVEGVSGSPAFGDVFGKVPRAPMRSDIGPMARPQREHPAYGAKDPVDGSACQVLAFPFFMTSSPPFDIIQNEDEILIVPEREGGLRHVYMNMKDHPPDLRPSSNGDSIGRWEGDTLVIDTVGFRGFAGVPGGGRRGPSTHLVERYRMADNGERLVVSFTWDDPTIYTKPHAYELNYYRMHGPTYAYEDWCDSGDPKEYQSVLGISVVGGASIYNQPAQNDNTNPNAPKM